MGTRHHQVVVSKDGQMKISQYGQWDGYPDGQGISILNYLRNGNLSKYQENLSNIPLITQEQCDEINKLYPDGFKEEYPYLSRDCGSDIHQMIEDGTVKFVKHISLDEAYGWCEGFYTIDFNKGIFSSEFHGASAVYQLNDLPTDEEYLKAMAKNNED